MSKPKPSDPEAYLRKKGWAKVDVPHPWAWQQAPLPAFYTLRDAVALQESLDRETASKRR